MKALFSDALRDSMDITTTRAFQEVDMPGGNNPTVLEGSCFCGKVHIRAETNMPYPFMARLNPFPSAPLWLVVNKPTRPLKCTALQDTNLVSTVLC